MTGLALVELADHRNDIQPGTALVACPLAGTWMQNFDERFKCDVAGAVADWLFQFAVRAWQGMQFVGDVGRGGFGRNLL